MYRIGSGRSRTGTWPSNRAVSRQRQGKPPRQAPPVRPVQQHATACPTTSLASGHRPAYRGVSFLSSKPARGAHLRHRPSLLLYLRRGDARQPSIPNPIYKPKNSRNHRTRIQIRGLPACCHVGDRYGRGRGGGSPPGAAAEAREEAALRGGRKRTRRRRTGPLRRRLTHPPQIGNADLTSPASRASTENFSLPSTRWNSGGRHHWLSKNQNSMLMEP